MKVWSGFGSEHSHNLRMIGRFATPEDAEVAERQLNELYELVVADFDFERFDEDENYWYTNESLREILVGLQLYGFSPDDIASLAGEHTIERVEDQVRVRTEEISVGGLIKFMIAKQARIEVYSAHDFPDPDPTRT